MPRAEEATGVRYKLATYSLNPFHESGGPKAKGFAEILGITIASIDYLEVEIHMAIQVSPIAAVRESPFGVRCVVSFPLRGTGAHCSRVVSVRTIWEIKSPNSPPRLVNAFLKP